MTPGDTHGEGHARPEVGPPGGLVDVLTRWEDTGGSWRVLSSSNDWIDFGLFTRDGSQQMSVVSGARTTVLRSYLAGRTSNDG